VKTNPITEVKKVTALHATGKRNSLLLYLASYGIDSIQEIFGSIEAFKAAVRPIYNRNNVPNEMKKIFWANRIMEGATSGDLPAPYLELKEKFIDGFFE